MPPALRTAPYQESFHRPQYIGPAGNCCFSPQRYNNVPAVPPASIPGLPLQAPSPSRLRRPAACGFPYPFRPETSIFLRVRRCRSVHLCFYRQNGTPSDPLSTRCQKEPRRPHFQSTEDSAHALSVPGNRWPAADILLTVLLHPHRRPVL